MKHLTGVVFDWAGTVVDHGSRAPAATLQAVFQQAGMPITVEQARRDMGIAKRDHIAAILGALGQRDETVVERLYGMFLPRQFAVLEDYSQVIAGVPAAMEQLRTWDLKVGSTTGYTRPMLDLLLSLAKAQGFAPDAAYCPEDVPGGGRPEPWMCYRNAIEMRTGPLWTMVKAGDTPSDIAEGRNAGMWTIGITRTGNEVGLTAAEWNALSEVDREAALVKAELRLDQAEAHYVAESVAECIEILLEIDERVAAGERP